ncbi:hypothetical protein RB195_005965 [Necator americanus]|uniref:Uncharacterized protein n=1 Tax=Necator americanus TaxID=51031 RepID=A0ABR1BTH6_NECAM
MQDKDIFHDEVLELLANADVDVAPSMPIPESFPLKDRREEEVLRDGRSNYKYGLGMHLCPVTKRMHCCHIVLLYVYQSKLKIFFRFAALHR